MLISPPWKQSKQGQNSYKWLIATTEILYQTMVKVVYCLSNEKYWSVDCFVLLFTWLIAIDIITQIYMHITNLLKVISRSVKLSLSLNAVGVKSWCKNVNEAAVLKQNMFVFQKFEGISAQNYVVNVDLHLSENKMWIELWLHLQKKKIMCLRVKIP